MVWDTAWKIVAVGVGFTQASICLLLQGLLRKLDLSMASLPGCGLSLTFITPGNQLSGSQLVGLHLPVPLSEALLGSLDLLALLGGGPVEGQGYSICKPRRKA